MNRIEKRFEALRSSGKKGFVVYIGAGDPDLNATHDLALAFDKLGVDVLELGVPFSDPLADGLVNQLAAQRGLESGTTPHGVLDTIKKIRQSSQISIVLYIYFNLIHKLGLKEFIKQAAEAGVDGLLVLDLPPEESENYEAVMREHDMSVVYLVALTTPNERIEKIVKRGTGFIYYVSREGVTGMRDSVASDLESKLTLIRKYTNLPIAVGFGISKPEHVKSAAEVSDAVVVGSAIVNQVAEHGKSPDLVAKVSEFVGELVKPLK